MRRMSSSGLGAPVGIALVIQLMVIPEPISIVDVQDVKEDV